MPEIKNLACVTFYRLLHLSIQFAYFNLRGVLLWIVSRTSQRAERSGTASAASWPYYHPGAGTATELNIYSI